MGKGNQSQDGFTKQLVLFSNIQPELDSEIVKLDPTIETSGLLKILTTYPETWMEREELKLKAKISEYVLQKFHPILSGSLESFLRKDLNMQTANNSTFAMFLIHWAFIRYGRQCLICVRCVLLSMILLKMQSSWSLW